MVENSWTYDELMQALMEDDTWEVPKEERADALMGLGWTLMSL